MGLTYTEARCSGTIMKMKCENRRQAIIDIAATLFREVGFDGASMSEISNRLGGSKATLYNYFKSKEELFVEVMMNAAEQAKKGINWCEYKKGDIVETLHELGQTYIKFIMMPPVIAIRRMLIAEGERSNIGKLYYERGPKKGWQKIADLLQEAKDNKELDIDDTWLAAMQLRGLLEAGLYETRLYGAITKATPKQMKETAKSAIDTFLKAYAVRK
jgi:AcrR family transcriptional regulator